MKTKPPSSMPTEPASRPKAKVSSSATVIVGRSSSSSSADHAIVKSTTRPPSPYKQSRGHARQLSSTRSAVDVHISRPKTSIGAHELSKQRSLTSTLEASFTGARHRNGSFHATPPSLPSPRLSPESASTSPAIRVKAKVSNVAKFSSSQGSSPPPASVSYPSSPTFATTRPIEIRPRAPSITDTSIFGSRPSLPTAATAPPTVHPITTPTFAANPHRYAPRIPSNSASRFQSLSPLSNRDLDNGIHVRVSSKVDPAAIPLPPQSPPASTLSFSSQSSRDTHGSSVSGSTAPTPISHLYGAHLTREEQGALVLGSGPAFDVNDTSDPNSPRQSPDSPVAHTDQLNDSDRKIRAEAKTNRKVTNYPFICTPSIHRISNITDRGLGNHE